MSETETEKKIKVLLELRPALEGYAGIPQECRLLFRGLKTIGMLETEGMIQTSHRVLAKGAPLKPRLFGLPLSEDKKINRYSRVVVSVMEMPYKTFLDEALDWVRKRFHSAALTAETLMATESVKLTKFDSRYFQDFIWRTLFSKTLPASDFGVVSSGIYRICSTPWNTLQTVGLNSLSVSARPKYPRLDTRGTDIFISQTPYPGRTRRGTALVVRYHDAIPIFMPHTISDKSLHQATHYHALKGNVASGAWFACVSEATRHDLIKLFPSVAKRAVTIHNMVSHHYFLEDSPSQRVQGIIRARLYGNDPDAASLGLFPKFLTLREQENFFKRSLYRENFKYLLVVSTIEPRKNHMRLLAAWEVIKAEIDPDLKLVIVGTLGWDYKPMIKGFRTWTERGDLFMLNSVPSPDLRVLYRHAAATICPSLGEGFDFSGVESMRSGGVVAASDIPVHREIYGDAAVYFDPYSTASLVKALKGVLYDGAAGETAARLRTAGADVSSRYLPERIMPQWAVFLQRVMHEGQA